MIETFRSKLPYSNKKLYIFSGSKCSLYTTLIGEQFKFENFQGETKDWGECYSGWRFKHNITPKIVNVVANSYHGQAVPENAYSGLYLHVGDAAWNSHDTAPQITFEFDEIRTVYRHDSDQKTNWIKYKFETNNI